MIDKTPNRVVSVAIALKLLNMLMIIYLAKQIKEMIPLFVAIPVVFLLSRSIRRNSSVWRLNFVMDVLAKTIAIVARHGFLIAAFLHALAVPKG